MEWMESLDGYKLFTEMFNDLDRPIDGCFDDGVSVGNFATENK